MRAAAASQPALHLAQARCGTFDVLESPQPSRTLALKVIVLPATERNESAIFPFGGGPGIPVTPGAELIEQDLFPPAFVADCRREIEAYADPSPINVVALSAGTRAALTLLARHPQSVRSMLLTGAVPPQNRLPTEEWRGSVPAIVKSAANGDWQSIAPAFIKHRRNFYDGVVVNACTDTIEVQFFDSGSFAKINDSCASATP